MKRWIALTVLVATSLVPSTAGARDCRSLTEGDPTLGSERAIHRCVVQDVNDSDESEFWLLLVTGAGGAALGAPIAYYFLKRGSQKYPPPRTEDEAWEDELGAGNGSPTPA